MKINRIILVGLLLGLVASIAVINCDDKPPQPPPPEEHLIYIGPEVGNLIKVFSVEQAAFVDSFVVDSIAETDSMYIHVIGDDSLLAVSAGQKTFIVNLMTKEVESVFNARKPIFSRNSNYYFCYYSTPMELHSFPDHALLPIEIPEYTAFPKFDNDEAVLSLPYLNINGSNYDQRLGIFDLVGDSIIFMPDTWQGRQILMWYNYPIGKYAKLYFGGTGGGYYLAATDFTSDTIRILKSYEGFSESISLPIVSPDDRYLFSSEIRGTFFGGVPDGHIYVFDAETEDSVAAIPYNNQGERICGSFLITDDSKYLMVRPFNEYKDITGVCLIDAQAFTVIGVYDCGFLPGTFSAKYAAKNWR